MLSLEIGDVLLSRFALIRLLGEGDVGQVWLAQDQERNVTVAIKVVNPHLASDPDRVERLENACCNIQRLIHPNIVRVFDFHRSGDLAFISTEYIDGQDLDVYRRRFGALSYEDMIPLIRPVIGALSHAHEMGLVHRDLKGANVLIDRRNVPRLADFGIAGVSQSPGTVLEITSNGSFHFMSPQHVAGCKPHPSDDIYALGVLMYELLTGYPPFHPEVTAEKIYGVVPPGVNQTLAALEAPVRVPESMDALISRLLAKPRDERPKTMEEIDLSLQKILHATPGRTVPPRAPRETTPSRGTAEFITPVTIPLQGEHVGRAGPVRRHVLIVSTLILALVGLLAGGGFLLQYLSKNPVYIAEIPESTGETEPEREDGGVQKPTLREKPVPAGASDPAQLALAKEEAEQRLAEFLRAKKSLDRIGGPDWGGDLYGEMIRLGREGDVLFMDRDFTAAGRAYGQALEKADDLAGQSEDALRRLLDEGGMALVAGDDRVAQEKFSVALLIDPENNMAQRGLEKAKNLEALLRLLASGKDHEQKNNLSFAYADYQEALKLDPESHEAQTALSRVKERIKDEQFRDLMSSGLAAFHNNDHEQARSLLLQARSFKPDAVEVRDALFQVDQAIRLARIETLRQKALLAEQSEDWETALQSYAAVLELDGAIQFASQGSQHCLEQIRIVKHIHFYLDKPHVLESDRHLEDAVRLVDEVSGVEPKGPQLKQLTEELTALVKAAQKPVRIFLESDNLTDVAIYKVGKFGRFETLELNLRPGTYTVVGSRSGYKDTRQVIVVKAGQEMLHVDVRCRGKI